MKKVLSFLMALGMITSVVTDNFYSQNTVFYASAEDEEEGYETESDGYYFIVYSSYAELIGMNEDVENVVIPDSVDKKKVTVIRDGAFYQRECIKSVKISANIEKIGYEAFCGTGISEITIPDNVKEVESRAFASCNNLKKITVSDAVSVDEGAFEDCGFINEPDSFFLSRETEEGICYREYLDYAVITGGLEAVDGVITIPSELGGLPVTKIGNEAFHRNEGLEKIVMPDTVTEIESAAFYECANLKTIVFSKNLKKIGNSAFAYCREINELSLPESLEEIGSEAFYNCGGLSEVVFPDGIKTIAYRAFSYCESLKSVKYPETAEVDENAFESSYYITETETHYRDRETEEGICYREYLDYAVITGGLEAVDGVITIPSELGGLPVTKIGYEAFRWSEGIEKIVMPDTVTEIENGAFYECENLKTIVFSKNLKKIGNSAFAYCREINELSLPESLEEIGSEAFYNCGGLSEVVFPDGIKTIAYRAFSYCESLKSVKYPETAEVDENAFESSYYITETETHYRDRETEEGICYREYLDYAVITGGLEAVDGVLTIPSELGGLPVTKIGGRSFSWNEKIEKIIIPDTVTEIEYYAFNECANLKTIVFSKNLKVIGESAFGGCSAIKEILLPESLEEIGCEAFYNCNGLSEVVFPDGIKIIAERAFGWCDSLKNVKYPETAEVDENAFKDSYYITDPENHYRERVTEDGISYWEFLDYAYYAGGIEPVDGVLTIPEKIDGFVVNGIAATNVKKPEAVTKVVIPDTVKVIKSSSFGNFSAIKEIKMPKSLEVIEEYAFSGCSELRYVDVPESVNVDSDAFIYCVYINDPENGYLTKEADIDGVKVTVNVYKEYSEIASVSGLLKNEKIVIPDMLCDYPVESIGVKAFAPSYTMKNVAVKEIILPETVKKIKDNAFYNLSTLESIKLPASLESVGSYAFYGCNLITEYDFGKTGIIELGENMFNGSNVTSIILPETLTKIPDSFCYGLAKLESINIPGGVTSIGNNAFYNCISLNEVRIPESVTEIGENAFGNCKNLNNVVLPDGISRIGARAFAGCSAFEEITIPEKLTEIEEGVFAACTALSSIEIPKNIETIGYAAFIGCTSLTEIAVPDTVKKIGDSAFSDCANLKSAKIPDKAEYGIDVFRECTSLEEVNIPSGLTEIPEGMFYECSSLSEVTIPKNVEKIGSRAFLGCSSLTSIEIPSNVKEIADNAFYSSNLKSVVLNEGIVTIGNRAFANCTQLKKINFPSTLEKIDNYAFSGCSILIVPDTNVKTIGEGAFDGCITPKTFTIGKNTVVVTEKDLMNAEISEFVVEEGNPVYKSVDGVLYNADMTELVRYPSAKTGDEYVIPDTVESLGDSAFYKCSQLESIVIPGSIETIPSYAFYNCVSLEKLVMGEGVKNIEGSAFANCTSLTIDGITFPESIEYIALEHNYRYDSYAFENTGVKCSDIKNPAERKVQVINGTDRYGNDYTDVTYVRDNVVYKKTDRYEYTIDSKTEEITSAVRVVKAYVDRLLCSHVDEVYITVDEIDGTPVTEFNDFYYSDDVTMYGKLNSAAFEYAKNNDIRFELIEVDENDAVVTLPETTTTTTETTTTETTTTETTTTTPTSNTTSETTTTTSTTSGTTSKATTTSTTSNTTSKATTTTSTTSNTTSKATTTSTTSSTSTTSKATTTTSTTSNTTSKATTTTSTTSNTTTSKATTTTSTTSSTSTTSKATTTTSTTSNTTSKATTTSTSSSTTTTATTTDTTTATTTTQNNNIDFEFNAERGEITKYNGKDTDVVIPSEIDGVAVKAIEISAFEGCSNITKVTIPDGVERIGYFAFANCSSLESINLPESLKEIKESAFSGCESITSVTIPDGITYIGYSVFNECSSLESITLPESIESIEPGTFTGCSALTGITLPKGIKIIGESAFSDCSGLKSITIPDGAILGEYAFFNCTGLESVIIPDSVTTIANSAFANCTSLTSVKIPDGVVTISGLAFSGCEKLENITIPASVKSIDNLAFCDCENLKSVTIPASVTSIGEYALGFETDENYDTVKKEGFTISGYKGSAAETYAKENGFEFIVLDDEPTPEFILGDVDGDGAVTAMDASAALTYYVMNPESIEDLGFAFNEKAADWDGNGIINAIDASAILTYYVSH